MGLELLLSSWLLCCGPSQLGADWAHLLSQVTLSRSAHLWPAAQAPSGARGCPWASGGWGFTAGEHRVRGLSQASPSNVKAIKATSSVRSRRASGSGAAATTHLTSPPTAPSLPQCGCAPGWTFSSSGGARLAPMHTCGRSQLWAPLPAKDQFLFLLPYSTWHPPHWPRQLQPQKDSRQDSGVRARWRSSGCMLTHSGWSQQTPSPWTPAYGGGEQRGYSEGSCIHKQNSLVSIGRGLGLLKRPGGGGWAD